MPFAGFQGGHQAVESHRAGLTDGFGFAGDVWWGACSDRDFVAFGRVEQVTADADARRESPPIVVPDGQCHCVVVFLLAVEPPSFVSKRLSVVGWCGCMPARFR
jgi:hypothetical protein